MKPRLLSALGTYWLKKARCSVLFRPSALSCGYLMLICMIFENKFQSHPGAFKNYVDKKRWVGGSLVTGTKSRHYVK